MTTESVVSGRNKDSRTTTLPDYYNQINFDLLALIPAHAAAVLEIGCGSGAMGEQYLQNNPECNYIGIEIAPDAAELAAN